MSEPEGRKAVVDGDGSGIGLMVETFRDRVPPVRSDGPTGGSEPVPFLPSPRPAHVTGQELVVDGGPLGSVPLAPMPN
ncbi:hypothetical protein [Micromonospora sp. CPCC 205561]|uniref:hypothetical protein n=1 Tax=Micromonospora sp. CPCC 205561 TaxID=3122407 RepID=UPI002FF0D973